MNTLLQWLNQIDHKIFFLINDTLAHPIFDVFFVIITNEHIWAIPVLIGLFLLFIRGGKRGKIAAVLVLITASVTDATVVQIIKPAIGRLRPSHALGDTINLLVPKGGRFGFVSAHAANIFAGTTVLSYFYKQWKKPLLFLAFSVALSRVYVGVHYPGDILFGGIFGYGMAWLGITLWVLLKMRELKRGRTWVRYS